LTKGIFPNPEQKIIEKKVQHIEQLKEVYSVNVRDVPDTAQTNSKEIPNLQGSVQISTTNDWEQEADDLVEWSKDLPTEITIE
jgi:hypothetical protein